MPDFNITYQNQVFSCSDNESLIDAFNRRAIIVNFSCKKGSCHVCMMQCDSGLIPENSQSGLKAEYINKNYFLPCTCFPVSNMSISKITPDTLYHRTIVHEKEILSKDVCKILIEPANEFIYEPGQYINLRRSSDGIARSYSLVSHPDDHFIEIHVKKMPSGIFSSWVFDELKAGDEIEYQGALGNSYYSQLNNTDSPIVLIGKGTGIAPLYGITQDALRHLHKGKIHIYHEGQSIDEVYLHEKLINLNKNNSRLNYTACISDTNVEINDEYTSPNRIINLLESSLENAHNPYIFIAGSPEFILSIKTLLKHLSVKDNNIFSDSFDYKNLRHKHNKVQTDTGRRSSDSATLHQTSNAKKWLSKDDEMWDALEKGKKLKIILDDFYSRVYQNSRLSGFFENSTKKRSSEKQYLFMRQIFTGEKVYFGDRPKNAHHWMVISNELFDYRETIMAQCLKDHDIPDHLIERWMNIDESFRQDIVKHEPKPKIINGVEMPLNGYESLIIDEGTICDGCNQAIEKGEMVRYHIRLGSTYCQHCIDKDITKKAM